MVGIHSFGAYIPRLRLQRRAVAAAHAWYSPGLDALAQGERAMASWDEDAITMAVEAARDCLTAKPRTGLGRLVLASTSHPFADRQNAGVVKEALNLPDAISTVDVGGSQRAGASALLDALQACAGASGPVLCLASELRAAAPASELELMAGDAAVALLVDSGPGMAEFLGGHSLAIDFVDHFRAAGENLDYGWESRWVRDEGYAKIAPEAVRSALQKVGLEASAVDHFVMAAPMRGVNGAVAAALGIAPAAVTDPLSGRLGDAGCAQPLLMLAAALAVAKAGEVLCLVGFGQGCDVLLFRATGEGANCPAMGVAGWLARRTPEENYLRYLVFRGHLAVERGMRAEFDQKTALTALYRNRKAVLGLVGGRCTETGVIQFPKTPVSVAQNARAVGTQEDYPFAERLARVLTHTSDRLTYSPDPPSSYGTIVFDEGGRMTVDFTDLDRPVEVGMPMRMMFRIKGVDEARNFTRYFWKAVPDFRSAVLTHHDTAE